MFFSLVLLKRKYTWKQILAVLVIMVGLFIAFYPSIFQGSTDAGKLHHNLPSVILLTVFLSLCLSFFSSLSLSPLYRSLLSLSPLALCLFFSSISLSFSSLYLYLSPRTNWVGYMLAIRIPSPCLDDCIWRKTVCWAGTYSSDSSPQQPPLSPLSHTLPSILSKLANTYRVHAGSFHLLPNADNLPHLPPRCRPRVWQLNILQPSLVSSALSIQHTHSLSNTL